MRRALVTAATDGTRHHVAIVVDLKHGENRKLDNFWYNVGLIR